VVQVHVPPPGVEAAQVLMRGPGPLPFAWCFGTFGVFLLFGCMTLLALLCFWRKVPETKGRSLQELEQEPTGRGVG
jgi:hypothetical protein